MQDDQREHHTGIFTRCLQLGLHLTAAMCSVATLWLLAHTCMSTAPGQANVGAGLAMLAITPSLFSLGISITTWKAATRRGRTALMLLAATLLVPSLLLLLLIAL